MSRILVVEDDSDTAQLVRAYLERHGYAVTHARDGNTGLASALEEPPALIVLDWMLPGRDGPGFLTRLRRERHTPVIMLTARSEEGDRIVGLELGADDYVTKPFSPRELVARIRAVLRRTASDRQEYPHDEPVEYSGLRIDPARREVTYGNREVAVTTLEFDLLQTLVGSPGRVFTRDDLLNRFWGPDFNGVGGGGG